MASTRHLILNDNVGEGMDYTSPSHLIGAKWRTQHNMRVTPSLEQVPNKVVFLNTGVAADVRWLGLIPTGTPGSGTLVMLTTIGAYALAATAAAPSALSSFTSSSSYFRYGTCIYNGVIYYASEYTPLRSTDGASDAAVANGLAARYVTTWYDHLVLASLSTNPNRLQMSGLYEFTQWTPAFDREVDFYDFVEWQQTDYPYSGITGVGKLKGTLWVYTPTAIIPCRYVGLPKLIQIEDSGVFTRIGNTFSYTLVCLDNVHFFYDGLEGMFFAFDGSNVQPIGEPVRRFLADNLSTDATLAAKMYGYVDVTNREIWWPFVSTASSGAFDMAVVFNYRFKKWFTASCEDIQCFLKGIKVLTSIGTATGTIADATGTIADAGSTSTSLPRLYGAPNGYLYRDEVAADAANTLVAANIPVLESGDKHYGDIRTQKENDLMLVNATWDDTAIGSLEVKVSSRDYLSKDVVWTSIVKVGNWLPTLEDGMLTYRSISGRVFRYKFTGVAMRGLKFSAYSEAMLSKNAEK